tara:strand:+ start:587 stop:1435 length:849 start_codon:yes stop_codon:yes gene_type:complete
VIKEVGLYFNNVSSNNGPGKVCQNLLEGLDRLGVQCHQNKTLKYTGCLNSVPVNVTEEMLLGPNLFVLPNDISPLFWQTKRNLVTPSEWVKNKYESQLGTGHNINVWPAGINTDKFKPGVDWSLSKTNDCMIYFKNGLEEQKQELIDILKKKNLSYQEITYGNYNEEYFIELTQASKFCVALTSTESQGIAYLEILSMNVPIYTVDKTVWDDRPGISFPATSAPYGDGRCGVKTSDGFSCFDLFLNYLHSFKPREYILENFTLEKCAYEYLSLLENCYESKE